MANGNLAKTYATIIGVVLVAVGLIGFIPNPIASNDPNAIFQVNAIHNIVHLLTGAAALYIAFGIEGEARRGQALMVFGAVYALVLIATLVDPELFGLFADAPVNTADHVLHAALALGSIAVGYLARNQGGQTVVTR